MKDRVFSAAELRLLRNVLCQACADVGPVDDEIQSIIANRILRMARDGERDFEALRSHATTDLVGSRHRFQELRIPDRRLSAKG